MVAEQAAKNHELFVKKKAVCQWQTPPVGEESAESSCGFERAGSWKLDLACLHFFMCLLVGCDCIAFLKRCWRAVAAGLLREK